MTRYLVSWIVDIDADDPTEAAQKALDMQRNPESIATVFDVQPNPFGRNPALDPNRLTYRVDLTEATVEEV